MAKILVVDDELLLREILTESISGCGHDVVTAHDVEQAELMMEEHKPQLALIDIKLPKSSGIELTKKIKELNPEMRIIIMTGYPSFDTIMYATKFGAVEYIIKPFKLDELNTTINKHLELI
jgi:DNA-binding NtrC family response regulator